MKKLIICFALITGMHSNACAQFIEGLDRKVKSKVKARVNNNVDQLMDKGLDETEKSIKNDLTQQTETDHQPVQNGSQVVLKQGTSNLTSAKTFANSRFDFVPGDVILYHDDFAEEAIGEMPVNWNASGNGQVVTLDGFTGKWLRMFPGTKYLTGNEKAFGENYTIEFDVLLNGTPPSGTRFLPDMAIGLFSSMDKQTTDNVFLLPHANPENITEMYLNPNVDAISRIKLESKKANSSTFKSESLELATFSKTIGKSVHYAMQVQKQRLRFWIDGTKIFDIPRAINLLPGMNQLYFNIKEYWPYNESNYGMYVSNIKIATGLPDMRHKLVETGTFSTTGILFDVNSDKIQPQSFGTIQGIAQVLKENPAIKVRIVGHTDSDGEAVTNLQLSRKRAEAVKLGLVKEFGIDTSRLETDGKGESQPVADNSIKESKALNRRVEFIKI